MTDNEIIKALECCSNKNAMHCSECSYYDHSATCILMLVSDALDLINRLQSEKEALINGQETLQKYIAEQKAEIADLQDEIKCEKETNEHLSAENIALQKECDYQKAEIERLTEAGKEAVSCFTRMESLYKIKCKELEIARAEAIKEFAERLKGLLSLNVRLSNEDYLDIATDIDNLVKEMVGDDRA